MWICRKCDKRADIAGKICRACGGILEEIPEGQPVAEAGQVVDADALSMPGPSGTESTEYAAKPPVVVKVGEESFERDFTGPVWKCPHCGSIVPGNFDVCWNCLTTKAGEPAPNAAQLLSEIGDNDQETAPDDSPSEAELLEETDQDVAAQAECPRCGSTKIIPDVTAKVVGAGPVQVLVFGNPQAFVFKDSLYGDITANICGQCGHIEFRACNPSELYYHYQESRGLDHASDNAQSSAVPCQKCRMLMIEGSGTCPHCGAVRAD
jgi:RNA polymerase subunit RPABC4/transcription elongation factor Spt4